MRRFVIVAWFFLFLCSIAYADVPASASASASAPVTAANPSPVVLTPEQARHALEVLNDPKARAKLGDTLRAIAAAGALSAPAASESTAAPAPASGASAVLAAAIAENGLISQLSRHSAAGLRKAGAAVRSSAVALLDVHSVSVWWRYAISSPSGRGQLRGLAGTLCAALFPAWLIGVLVGRMLKRRVEVLAANGSGGDSAMAGRADAANGTNGAAAGDAAAASGLPAMDPYAERAARSQRNAAYAGRHWSRLQRLPYALLHTFAKAIPLIVAVIIAVLAMSALTDDGTPEERVLDTLIQIYAIARLVALACGLLFAADAPKLRLLPMTDANAAFVEHWLVRLVTVVAIGVALAEAPVPLGLSAAAHQGIVKAVTLVGHVMIAILILQVRRPVRQWIRDWSARGGGAFAFIGHWLADAWAFIAVFVVIALWFVWALDVRNGYRVLLGHGGVSLAILIGARLVAIVASGVLGRIFKSPNGEKGSIALQRAHRYYPLLRRLISLAIVIVALNFILSVWDVRLWDALYASSIGSRLLSACITVAIAALAAIVVWEAVNVSIERRLGKWTASGDLMRTARLRTLLPMFRTTLFVAIALVVGLTGLSEIGVNIGPLLAGASIFGVALGFGSQKLVQDFITGMFLLMENALQVGDWVTVAGVSGTVEYLSIRTVRLRGGDGSLHTIPFSSVTVVNNTNRGLGNAAVRVSIAYGADVDLATETLNEIGVSLREDPQFKDGIVSDFSFWGVDQVDGAMVTLVGQIQCRDTARWPVQREFNRRILDMFRARGIEIANPLRTMVVPGDFAQPEKDTEKDTEKDDAASESDERRAKGTLTTDVQREARSGSRKRG
jgi:moderate conductance mechanosensitive channel